ncbi:MAG: hypothetical protein KGI34_00235 [Bradyrhizobium sp.]|uniref:hypothetical protein n=1 Tax=Bradyrhizobium sp. TaxID=376 RepID=UPI00239E7820|nr:hypothetical protein [Bradyrhizobium sp.]MDE1932398.1 hypothetical protein [Bradyrhizobium sp.]
MRSAALIALVWVLAAGTAWPQTAVPLQQAPAQLAPSPGNGQVPGPQSDAPQPAAPENPGLFNEMGKMLEKSLSILPSLKSPGETLDELHAKTKDVVKDAGESLSRLATPSSMATGRIPCPAAANGAADCKMAADRLCQSKGFKEGKSLSTDSVEACSAKVLIPGRTRKPGDCRTDNFVTRALCQ